MSDHVQFDLFVPWMQELPLRDQTDLMERPFFSLAKKKRIKPIEYQSPDGKIWVRVEAMPEYGMATIYDADILIWAASHLTMRRRFSNSQTIPPTLNFQAYDLLRAIKRPTGGDHYQRLRAALDRLTRTVVTTNIRTGPKRTERTFSYLEGWADLIDDKSGKTEGMSLTVSQWLYEGIFSMDQILAVHPDYFNLTSGLERWIYKTARKHAGHKQKWGFSLALPTLYEKSGVESTFRQFKFDLKKIVTINKIPEFYLTLEQSDTGQDILRMVSRYQLPITHSHYATLPPNLKYQTPSLL